MARCTIHLDTHPGGIITATFVSGDQPPLIVEGPGGEVARVVAVQMPSLCRVLEDDDTGDEAIPA